MFNKIIKTSNAEQNFSGKSGRASGFFFMLTFQYAAGLFFKFNLFCVLEYTYPLKSSGPCPHW